MPHSAAISLRCYYERDHRRFFLADARPGTLKEYAITLRHWERLTTNPSIRDLNTQHLLTFKAALLESGMAKTTANKYLRHIHALLAKLGPRSHRNRDALNLIPDPPWCKPYSCASKLPRFIPQPALRAIYDGCAVATLPRPLQQSNRNDLQKRLFFSDETHHPENAIGATTWWRALIVVTYCLAIRRRVALSLRWAAIDLHAGTATIDSTPDKADTERIKPLHPEALRHLLTVRSTATLVFVWTHGKRQWYAQWHAIQDAAGVDEHFHFHDLKRTAGTELGKYASAFQIQGMLDHRNITTSQRYVSPIAGLQDAVDRLPTPWAYGPQNKEENA